MRQRLDKVLASLVPQKDDRPGSVGKDSGKSLECSQLEKQERKLSSVI